MTQRLAVNGIRDSTCNQAEGRVYAGGFLKLVNCITRAIVGVLVVPRLKRMVAGAIRFRYYVN